MKPAMRDTVARDQQADVWTCFLGGLIVLLVAVLLAVAFWDWQFMFRFLGLSEKSEVLKYLGISVGGLVLMLQAVIANRRANAMQQTAEAQVRANENTEHGLRQERLKNAIEHLGSESESVRLGGAYELFHLAQDTRDNDSIRQTVLDILCAHIRRTTGEDAYQDKHSSKPSEEIQSLLTLLFVQGHDLFTGLRINLRESWLNGAELRRARLREADMRRAKLNEAILNDADLRKAILVNTHLKEARLERTCLREADLSEAQLQGAGLSEAQLQGADLSFGQLAYAFLPRANLQGTFLYWTYMYGTMLTSAMMQGARLSWIPIQEASFNKAKLQGAGDHDWESSMPFAERIRMSIGKQSDPSKMINGPLAQKRVDQLVDELLSPERKYGLKMALMPYSRASHGQDRHGLPQNHQAILGSYTEKEAEQWIAEHEAAMTANRQG